MNRINIKRIPVVLVLLILFTHKSWAQADFTRYYTLGDSLSAGFTHGSLNVLFQPFSFPALLAQQANVQDFEQPLISDPGIPARLVLTALLPSPVLIPKGGLGAPLNLNLPRPYNNLAVPGADLYDVLQTLSDGGLHDVILRGLGTQLQQFQASNPTFATVWIGNNDLLGAVVSGRVIPGITVTNLQDFVTRLQQIFDGIALLSDAKVVVMTLPNALLTPYATTIPPVVVNPSTKQPVLDANGNPIPLIGPEGPLPPNSLVLLPASFYLAEGVGIPVALGGNGMPLPDDVVLSPSEIDQITSTLDAFNNEIKTRAVNAGFAVFDINPLINQLLTTGTTVGGVQLTGDFLIGGLFGYDGIHPSPLGYAVLTNLLIDFINKTFGNNLPPLNLLPFITGKIGGVPTNAQVATTNGFRFSPRAVRQLLTIFAPKYLKWLSQSNSRSH